MCVIDCVVVGFVIKGVGYVVGIEGIVVWVVGEVGDVGEGIVYCIGIGCC